MLLPDLSTPIRGLEKGKMRGGVARAHEKSPSVVKQKATECYDTDKNSMSVVTRILLGAECYDTQ
jgi:hypothetical protein